MMRCKGVFGRSELMETFMKYRIAGLVAALLLVVAGFSLAASSIELRDGTTVVGEVRKIGNSYQIIKSDGSKIFVPATEILSIDGKVLEGTPPATTRAPSRAASDTPVCRCGR